MSLYLIKKIKEKKNIERKREFRGYCLGNSTSSPLSSNMPGPNLPAPISQGRKTAAVPGLLFGKFYLESPFLQHARPQSPGPNLPAPISQEASPLSSNVPGPNLPAPISRPQSPGPNLPGCERQRQFRGYCLGNLTPSPLSSNVPGVPSLPAPPGPTPGGLYSFGFSPPCVFLRNSSPLKLFGTPPL
nr:immunoglobulin-like protein [Salmonid herpesvirus 1]